MQETETIVLVREQRANRPRRTRISSHYGHVDVVIRDGREVVETTSSGMARVLERHHGFTRAAATETRSDNPQPVTAEEVESDEPAVAPASVTAPQTLPEQGSPDEVGRQLSAMRLSEIERALPAASPDAVRAAVRHEQARATPRRGALLLFRQRIGVAAEE